MISKLLLSSITISSTILLSLFITLNKEIIILLNNISLELVNEYILDIIVSNHNSHKYLNLEKYLLIFLLMYLIGNLMMTTNCFNL